MKTVLIEGMHCAACKKLITMELEEAGLADLIDHFGEPSANKGELFLSDTVSDEQIHQIQDTINAMNDYSVIESV